MLVPKLVLNGFYSSFVILGVLGLASALEFFTLSRPLEPAEACSTELKPLLTILGTRMRAI
jgi:hypothetical protein